MDLALVARERRVLDAPLSGTIASGQVDLSVLQGFSTAVADASGSFAVNLTLDGTLRQPLLRGGITVSDGALALPNLGTVRVRDVHADLAFLGDSLAVRRLEAASADIRAQCDARRRIGSTSTATSASTCR